MILQHITKLYNAYQEYKHTREEETRKLVGVVLTSIVKGSEKDAAQSHEDLCTKLGIEELTVQPGPNTYSVWWKKQNIYGMCRITRTIFDTQESLLAQLKDAINQT